MSQALKKKIQLIKIDLSSILSRDTVFFLIADILFYCTSSVVGSFLSILITTKVAPNRLDSVGLIFTLYQVSYAVAPFCITRLIKVFKGKSKGFIVSIAYLVSGLVTILLGFSNNLISIAILFAISGFFDGIAYPIKNTTYSKLIKGGSDEKAWGLLSFLNTAIPAVFLTLISIITKQSTIPIIFAVSGTLTVFAGIFFGQINMFKKEILKKEKISKSIDVVDQLHID